MRKNRPHTPDGRYFVARGMLRRCTNPALGDSVRRGLIKALMQARMTGRGTAADAEMLATRDEIQAIKVQLGEAGPVWWDDGAEDVSGQHPVATSYADWWQSLPQSVRHEAEQT